MGRASRQKRERREARELVAESSSLTSPTETRPEIRELHLGSSVVPADPLTDVDVESFVRDGVVQLRGAFPQAVADECRSLLWQETGCSPDDPSTWTRPVIRIEGRGDAPFTAAITAPRLCAALDQLAGPARWVPRTGIGTFPIRFPHDAPPSDDG